MGDAMKLWMGMGMVLALALALGLADVPEAGAQPGGGSAVERDVRKAFDTWATALATGDKKTYLGMFWPSPRLVIRVGANEYRGFDVYRKRIEAAELPRGNVAEYRNVRVLPLGRDAAVVTYDRPAPGSMGGGGGGIVFFGTLVFARLPEGWRIATWHAHAQGAAAMPHAPQR